MPLGIFTRIALFIVGFPAGLALGLAMLGSLRVGTDLARPEIERTQQFWPMALVAPEPHGPPAPLPSVDPGTDDLAALQAALVSAAGPAQQATVLVLAADHRSNQYAVGSGVLVSADGLILTAGHVIGAPGEKVSIVLADDTELTGRSLGLSLYSDAGMVKVEPIDGQPFPFVRVAEPAEEPEPGDWVFALGHPGGLDSERGSVLRLGHVKEVLDAFTFVTSCKLLGGDSGGPLFDLSGRLVGIHSRISDSLDGNYHARTAAFQRRWGALSEGMVLGLDGERGSVGVQFRENTDEPVVVGFEPDSPALEAELRVGDIFTHVNDDRIATATEFASLVAEHFSGDTISLRYVRNGIPATVEISLAEIPKKSVKTSAP